MQEDVELLRRYVDARSEDAFSELVRRNIGLVYHAALRRCGNPHLAEDVSQAVFTDLARKAPKLVSRPALAGWLHTSARYATLREMRSEKRRRAREQAAQAIAESGAPAQPGPAEPLGRAVDNALDALGERDREAVLLRFFEGRPFAEVGSALAVTEDAARMRVERALEKMRAVLRRQGLTSAALAADLGAQAGTAVPAEVAGKVASSALGANGSASLIAFMTLTKLQTCAALALAALGAAGLAWQHHANRHLKAEVADLGALREENARLRAQLLQAARVQPATLPAPRATVAPDAARAASAVPRASALSAGMTPVETLGNAGRASPRATFATQLWAARTGDVALEATTLEFGPEARARLEALAQTLPPDLRSEYDTPEKLMAYMLAGSPHPVGGMQVLGEVSQGPDDVTLQTEWQHVDDPVVHQSDVALHQEPDGWKWVVPAGLVNRAANYLTWSLGNRQAPAAPAPGK